MTGALDGINAPVQCLDEAHGRMFDNKLSLSLSPLPFLFLSLSLAFLSEDSPSLPARKLLGSDDRRRAFRGF